MYNTFSYRNFSQPLCADQGVEAGVQIAGFAFLALNKTQLVGQRTAANGHGPTGCWVNGLVPSMHAINNARLLHFRAFSYHLLSYSTVGYFMESFEDAESKRPNRQLPDPD